jgi:putative ABC transport system permease protein
VSFLRQASAVTAMNLRSLPTRLGTSVVIVVGIAAVVGVLISVLAMATGFVAAAAKSGRADRAIVLSSNAETEANSGVARVAAASVMDAPGIGRTSDGSAVASAEVLAFIPLTDKRTGLDSMVTLRGVGAKAFALRPEMKLIEGRMFAPAVHEVIVGRAASTRLDGLSVGRQIALPQGDWTVVGVFDSNGDTHESELLTDADTLISAFQRGDTFSSVTVGLERVDSFDTFKNTITTDPTLSVEVKREPDFFADASRPIGRLLTFIAYVIGGIMAVGSVFAALNTMYSAISARTTEIATLRAIGFGAGSVVVSVFVEALLLALVGAVIGASLAWFFFNGSSISTLSGTSPSQLTYALVVSPELIAIGVGCACAIGALGGLFPAIRAAKLPVAAAMRLV